MILMYAENITPRLQYIIDFVSEHLFDRSIELTSDLPRYLNTDLPKINYSSQEYVHDEFYIKNCPLLFETGIRAVTLDCFEINFHKAFFQTSGDLPFDIFAASFYLLSRYEEYLPHQKDEYGRYAYHQSLAYKENFLHLPLVDIWIEELGKGLHRKFPNLILKKRQFNCIISYDIDIAYSYLHKDPLRKLGGMVRSFVKGDIKSLRERIKVLQGKKKDPYDCYEWLDALHLYCRIKPYYFFLVARKKSTYDRNISTNRKALTDLIKYYSKNYHIGIHPSWQSGDDPRLLKEEIEWLETVADKKMVNSRQHYIRFTLPVTFRELLSAGIERDFSMGYGSVNGFRASTCSWFYWYDLEKEEQTRLQVFPFCFMDANSFYEQKQSAEEAYRELTGFYEISRKLNGLFVSIWHNNLLGENATTNGWRAMFELFMKETVYWDAFYDGY